MYPRVASRNVSQALLTGGKRSTWYTLPVYTQQPRLKIFELQSRCATIGGGYSIAIQCDQYPIGRNTPIRASSCVFSMVFVIRLAHETTWWFYDLRKGVSGLVDLASTGMGITHPLVCPPVPSRLVYTLWYALPCQAVWCLS